MTDRDRKTDKQTDRDNETDREWQIYRDTQT